MAKGSVISLIVMLTITVLAALSRHLLPTIESRVHILVFLMAVGIAEWGVKPIVKLKPRLSFAVLGGVCTTGAILAVRWQREGLCPHTWPQCPDPISAYGKLLGL